MIALVQDKLAQLAEACRRHRVRRLYLFGSAARGDFRERDSDLDFLVEFEPMDPAEHADCYFGLADELEGLFGRAVDLVERQAVRNGILLRAIDDSRVLVHEAA